MLCCLDTEASICYIESYGGRDGDLLTIKGDGSYVAMEVCNVCDVIGRVQAVIRPSGMEIPVVSWKWKLPSFIWNKMGILRNPILKILHHMF